LQQPLKESFYKRKNPPLALSLFVLDLL